MRMAAMEASMAPLEAAILEAENELSPEVAEVLREAGCL